MSMKYLGGAYIVGVPARDLTDDEEQMFGATITEQQELTGVKLYKRNPEKRAKPAPKDKEAK